MEDLFQFIEDLNERGPQIRISPQLTDILKSSLGYIKNAINVDTKEKKD